MKIHVAQATVRVLVSPERLVPCRMPRWLSWRGMVAALEVDARYRMGPNLTDEGVATHLLLVAVHFFCFPPRRYYKALSQYVSRYVC